MNRSAVDPQALRDSEDWYGNNVALTCPVCSKVFIVSGLQHLKNGRTCPECGRSRGHCTGAIGDGDAWIEWEADPQG